MSNFRDKYKKQKQDLMRRHEDSVADKTSGQFGSICDLSKIPKGVGFWKCPPGQHVIDIIPFLAGGNMPKISGGGIKKGEFIWLVDLWVHGYVGALEYPYICPTKTNGQPCPICEHLSENKGSYSEEEYNNLKAKRRTLYLIWSHDSAEDERKGLQIWEVAHYFMENNLKVIAERPRGGGTIPYFDPDNGKQIAFTRQGSGATSKYLGHRFDDREGPIPDEILDQSFELDSILKYASYEEIYAAFYGKSADEEERDAAPTGVGFEPEPEPEPEEEAPIADDEPPFAAEDELAPDECPVGGQFGYDIDQLEACGNCERWDDCYAANQELIGEPEPEPVVEPEPEPPPKPTPPRRVQSPLRTPTPAAAPQEEVRKPKPTLRRRS